MHPATPLIEPKEITVTDGFGNSATVTISKIPAVPCREIGAKYPLSSIPKLGDYKANEETMFKLMSYVAVSIEGKELRLGTEALINNHIKTVELLFKIEMAMLEYNFSFFGKGLSSGLLESIKTQAQALTSKILTALSEQSSGTAKRRSMS